MTAEPATPASIPPESGPALRREQISPPAEELFPSAEPSQGELGLAVEPESVESSGDAMNEDRPSDRFREPETPDSGESELEQNPVGPVPREAEPE